MRGCVYALGPVALLILLTCPSAVRAGKLPSILVTVLRNSSQALEAQQESLALTEAIEFQVNSSGEVDVFSQITQIQGEESDPWKPLEQCSDSACASDVAGALNVDYVLFSSVQPLGRPCSLSMKIVESKTGRLVPSCSVNVLVEPDCTVGNLYKAVVSHSATLMSKARGNLTIRYSREAPKRIPSRSTKAKTEVDRLKVSCETGVAISCMLLGNRWLLGKTSRKDLKKARMFYERACSFFDSGAARSADGCGFLAYMYEEGMGGRKSQGEARKLYEKACNGGSGFACNNLGYLYHHGIGVEKDPVKGRSLGKLGCMAKTLADCLAYGEDLFRGVGGNADREQGRALIELACEGNDSPACDRLALEIAGNANDIVDISALRKSYEKDCRDNNVAGCIELARMLRNGRGGPKDESQARELLRKACDRGHCDSCDSVGMMLQWGRGGSVDLFQARKAYSQACECGKASSCFFLSIMWRDGLGGAKNESGAKEMARVACKLGYQLACY